MTKSEMMLRIATAYGKLKDMTPDLVKQCSLCLAGKGPMPGDDEIRAFKAAHRELVDALEALQKRIYSWLQPKFTTKALNIFKDKKKLADAREEAKEFQKKMKNKTAKLEKKIESVIVLVMEWNMIPRAH